MKLKVTEQPNSSLSPILTIPKELFLLLMSFISTKAHLALALTCKDLYDYYKQSYSEQMFTVLCEAQCTIDPTKYIRVLERRMHQTG
jgi:hypothetical protein